MKNIDDSVLCRMLDEDGEDTNIYYDTHKYTPTYSGYKLFHENKKIQIGVSCSTCSRIWKDISGGVKIYSFN